VVRLEGAREEMSTGLPLFDHAQGPEATRRAAARAAERFAGDHRSKVLRFIESRGQAGATDEEVSEELGLKLDTSRARRCELRDDGQILDGGRRRRTRSGRLAICWVAAQSPRTSTDPPANGRPPAPIGAAIEAPRQTKGIGPCPRCGCRESIDVPIHRGESVRRDCRKCGLFREFPIWQRKERPGAVK
jgi:hypothetical protein